MQKKYYKVADRPDSQIEAFKNRYDFVSEDEIKNVFLKNWYEVESLEKSSSWWTAHLIYYAKIVWKKDRLVFRSNSWDKWGFIKPEIVMLSEKLITDKVLEIWVSTNKILFVDISRKYFPFDYQIEEELLWVDPEKYIDNYSKFLGKKEDYDKLSYELWQSVAKYSDIKFNWFWLFDEDKIISWDIEWIDSNFYDYITTNLEEHLSFLLVNNVIDKNIFDRILGIYKYHKDLINDCESCLIHHDLADHNLTYDVDKKWLWAIFDWEAMVLWDSMLDLWSCPTWETHYPRKNLLVQWYKSIKKLPDNYETRMNLYELRTWIWKIMFSIKMNFDKKLLNSWINSMNTVLKEF